MGKRRHISLKTKLASALLALGHVEYGHARLMTEDQLLSLYNWDHGILHSIDPVDAFWNLQPKLIAAHRVKSVRDTSIVAKVKRLERGATETRRILLERGPGDKREPRSKIKGRGFDKSLTKGFNGTVTRRKRNGRQRTPAAPPKG